MKFLNVDLDIESHQNLHPMVEDFGDDALRLILWESSYALFGKIRGSLRCRCGYDHSLFLQFGGSPR